MSNSYFQFKQFTIHQDQCAMKVTTDACLFGAWVADEINNEELKINNCLDIGAGTGLLSLILAQKNPEIKTDAIEIDKDAAEQAKINIATSPWKEQINTVQGDVKGFSFEKEYDLIISNPPFYENEIRSGTDSKNVAHHSENLTLKELLVIIKDNLNKTGSFFLLLPYKRNEEIKKLLKTNELNISKILFVRQSVKHDYFRIMLKGKLNEQENAETEFNEMSIWDDSQQYTSEFKQLLKEYYLHL
jgi:tRNA1Val (adenine37-N6)-methyltransferase